MQLSHHSDAIDLRVSGVGSSYIIPLGQEVLEANEHNHSAGPVIVELWYIAKSSCLVCLALCLALAAESGMGASNANIAHVINHCRLRVNSLQMLTCIVSTTEVLLVSACCHTKLGGGAHQHAA